MGSTSHVCARGRLARSGKGPLLCHLLALWPVETPSPARASPQQMRTVTLAAYPQGHREGLMGHDTAYERPSTILGTCDLNPNSPDPWSVLKSKVWRSVRRWPVVG